MFRPSRKKDFNPHASNCLTCKIFLKHKRMKHIQINLGEEVYFRWQCLPCWIQEDNDQHILDCLTMEWIKEDAAAEKYKGQKNQQIHFRQREM